MSFNSGPSYLTIREHGPNSVRRTVGYCDDDILVDVGAAGQILGIERLSGPVNFDVLLVVLTHACLGGAS